MCGTMPGLYFATYWLLAGMEEVELRSVALRATNAEDALGEAIRAVTSDGANYVSVFCEGEEVAASTLAIPAAPPSVGFEARLPKPHRRSTSIASLA